MRYEVSGFHLKSELDLKIPESNHIGGKADLNFAVSSPVASAEDLVADMELAGEKKGVDETYLFRVYKDDTQYLIRDFTEDCYSFSLDAQHIVCHPHPDSHPDHFRDFLLSCGLTFALYLRQVPVLHGSSVQCGEGAVAFLGGSGAGKTTLAGNFVQRDHRLLSDDTVILSDWASQAQVTPSFPVMKLRPQTVDFMELDKIDLPVVNPETPRKRLVVGRAGNGLLTDPLPLSAVYVLEQSQAGEDSVYMARMGARDGLVALVTHTMFGFMMGRDRLQHMTSCYARLAEQVPLYRLAIPRKMQFLAEARQRILSELEHRIAEPQPMRARA